MLEVELTPEEKEMLREMLESEISDLSEEIAHTDSFDYRDALRQRRGVLQKLVEAIAAAP